MFLEPEEKKYNSSEFIVTFPDDTQQVLWSPVWNELEEDDELKEAQIQAEELWHNKMTLDRD